MQNWCTMILPPLNVQMVLSLKDMMAKFEITVDNAANLDIIIVLN